LDEVKPNSLTIFTLGANPLLSRWMGVNAGFITVLGGENISCTDSVSHAKACMATDIKNFFLKEHLANIYKQLLQMGSHVLVQKYYRVCPWSFGNNDPKLNVIGPSRGRPCDGHHKEIAAAINDQVNATIDAAVDEAKLWALANNITDYRIGAVCPGGSTAPGPCPAWDAHQFGSPVPYVTYEDTGVHPSATGHREMAMGLYAAACSQLGIFCEEQRQAPLNWPSNEACTVKDIATGIGRCSFVSIYNNTSETLTLIGPNPSTAEQPTHGKWYMYPREVIPPHQVGRFVVTKQLNAFYGSESYVAYQIGSGAGRLFIYSLAPYNLITDYTVARGGATGPYQVSVTGQGKGGGKTSSAILNIAVTPAQGSCSCSKTNGTWCRTGVEARGLFKKTCTNKNKSNGSPDTYDNMPLCVAWECGVGP
jgi:hypothetical protein